MLCNSSNLGAVEPCHGHGQCTYYEFLSFSLIPDRYAVGSSFFEQRREIGIFIGSGRPTGIKPANSRLPTRPSLDHLVSQIL